MLDATHLQFSRSGKPILRDVSLSVKPGQVLGLLGRNGAGKTTTLRILCGLLHPDDGEVKFSRPSVRVGSLIETPGFYPNLTAFENLRIFSPSRTRAALDDLKLTLALVGLEEVGDKRVGQYSLGMKQRLGMARALAGHPDLVVLDEPTNGLDPQGIFDIRQLIRSQSSKNGTAFLVSSHLLSEVELLADVVSVIEGGQTVATLEAPAGEAALAFELEVERAPEAADRIRQTWSASECEVQSPQRLVVRGADPGSVNELLVQSGHRVSLLRPRGWSLEQRVMPLMKGGL